MYRIDLFHRKNFIIYHFPIFVTASDVIINVLSILEIFVTGWAFIIIFRTKVDFTHVSFHITSIRREPFFTYQADIASFVRFSAVVHEVVHS